jgi:hypothetical protein
VGEACALAWLCTSVHCVMQGHGMAAPSASFRGGHRGEKEREGGRRERREQAGKRGRDNAHAAARHASAQSDPLVGVPPHQNAPQTAQAALHSTNGIELRLG